MSTKTGTASGYAALLDIIDAFLVDQGHAWGKTFAGTGTGDLTLYLGTATSVAETFTLTATSATNFTVSGSISGSLAAATVGTTYIAAKITFRIVAGGTAFVAGDVFTINTSPKWTRLRAAGCIGVAARSVTGTFVAGSAGINVFDNSAGTFAQPNAFPAYFNVQLRKAAQVLAFQLSNGASLLQAPKDIGFEYSDDGSAWASVQTWTGLVWTASSELKTFTLAAPPGAHLYWRVKITSTQSGQTVALINEVQLLEAATNQWFLEDRYEAAWMAPGLDGTKAIYSGVYLNQDVALDYYNMVLCGFRFYDAKKSVRAQQNSAIDRVLSMTDQPMSYWLVANGQRLVILARVSTVYQLGYLGFGFPYETPTVHAYPAIVAGTGGDVVRRWSSTVGVHRICTDPGLLGMAAYYPDAAWREHQNANAGSDQNGSPDQGNGKVWPAANAGDGSRLDWLRQPPDGSFPLYRAVLSYAPTVGYPGFGVRHVWGEFDGLYWMSGFGNTAESLVRDEGFDHLVFSNVFRTTAQSFAALRLD